MARLARVLALAVEKARVTVDVEVASALADAGDDGFRYLVQAAARDGGARALLAAAVDGARRFLRVGRPTMSEWVAATEVDRGAMDWVAGEGAG